jgi:hypothetical protein
VMVADAEIVRDRESRIRRYVSDLRDMAEFRRRRFSSIANALFFCTEPSLTTAGTRTLTIVVNAVCSCAASPCTEVRRRDRRGLGLKAV